VHFVRLATTLLKDEESARDNHVLAGNFAKYSPIHAQKYPAERSVGSEETNVRRTRTIVALSSALTRSLKVAMHLAKSHEYQLSLIDPRDKIVLQTELSDLCSKLYSGRASELGGTVNLVDRRRFSISRSSVATFPALS